MPSLRSFVTPLVTKDEQLKQQFLNFLRFAPRDTDDFSYEFNCEILQAVGPSLRRSAAHQLLKCFLRDQRVRQPELTVTDDNKPGGTVSDSCRNVQITLKS